MRIIILFLACPFLLFAQQTIDAERFFSLGLSNLEGAKNINLEKVNFPWIEEYELRSETRDFDFDQQEYTFRVSPSTSKKRQAQKALYQQLNNVPDFEFQEVYCDRLLSVHIDWLSLYMINENLSLLQSLSEVIRDKQSVYEKMAGAYDFDFQELVKLQTDKSDLAIAINELELELAFICDKYGISNSAFDFQDFVSVDHISNSLDNDSSKPPIAINPEAAYEQELVARELSLEKSENRQFFDFAQLKYQGPHSDQFQERLSLGIGLRLPNSGNRKLKIKELELKQKEYDREAQRDAQEWQQVFNVKQQELLTAIKGYQFYISTIAEERTQLKNLGTQISKREGFNPLLLLDIEERHLATKLKELNQKEDILFDYLMYLEQAGQLCQQPLVNYLKS